MNLDELKTAWKTYDRKIQSTQQINEKIIVSMIADRSSTRFSSVQRNYLIGIAWMMFCLSIGVLVLVTNPFDYEHFLQYIPTVIFCISLSILIGGMIKAYRDLQRVSITHNNLAESLKQIITVYEKPKQFLKYTLIVFLFTQVFLFPMSFLPRSIERMGFWPALAERMIPIAIVAGLLILANKLGAFKEREGERFKNDLSELQELKALAMELKNEN